MSTLKVNKLRDTAGSADAITLDPNGGAVLAGVTTVTSVKVGAAVTISESGIEATGVGITCANINGGQIGGRRNLIINGDMQIAQRATSVTGSNGYVTCDRFNTDYGGENEAPTYEQGTVASGTTPYTEGFRKTWKVTNGDQTSVDAGDYIFARQKIEAQDLARSGWNYTSSSSFITLSFWVKSSVAQTFYGRLESVDGTSYNYPYSYAVSADTWTKVVKTIPGNSNLQIDNDNGSGMEFHWQIFRGTSFTSSDVNLNTWATYASAQRTPDATSTWWETNDATWEMTGVQVEVGSQATAFEHRSFGQELSLCHRYYYLVGSQARDGNPSYSLGLGALNTDTSAFIHFPFPTEMRATPTLDHTNGADYYRFFNNGGGANLDGAFTIWNATRVQSFASCSLDSNLTGGGAVFGNFNDNSAQLGFTAEL